MTHIDEILKEFKIERKNFMLLISDAASYMLKAGETLKVLYPDCFHVTCFSHLLHNCAMRVKSHYPDVDNLIASTKALTIKNRSRKELFKDIGYPPQPVVTRWGSWLQAASYYAKNLPEIRKIVESINDEGMIVSKAKLVIFEKSVGRGLLEIVNCYSHLSSLIIKAESAKYTIENAIKDSETMDFGNGPSNLSRYYKT